MKTLAAVAFPLIIALASSCGPSEAADDVVDAGGDALVTGREVNVDCVPETYEVRRPDGSATSQTTWYAHLAQPFEWSKVSVRICNPVVEGESAPTSCPSGWTCTGTPANPYPFCRSGVNLEQLGGGGDDGRIWCGATISSTTSGGVTTVTGYYYRLAQIHLD